MKQLRYLICGAAAVGLLGLPTAASAESLAAKWKNGLRFESEDGNVVFKVGGRIMNDWTVWLSEDEELEEFLEEDLQNGTEIRRARFYMAGQLYRKFIWKAQYDYAGGDATFKDMYVGLINIPFIGMFRVGHQYEPQGLEVMTSSKYITFIERSPGASTFAAERNTGFRIDNTALDNRLLFSAGIYRNADDFGNEQGEDAGFNYTGRVVFAPVYDEDGETVVHLGGSYSFASRSNDEFRFRARPSVHQSPRFVDTGTFEADRAGIVGAEIAGVFGPLSVQGEFFNADLDSDDADDPNFSGFYTFASFFLTGERRPYDLGEGVFGRVKPNEDFIAEVPGSGAWEVAARYSWIDLDDGLVEGGELQDVTVGLNWYLHPNARVMLNYIYADLDEVGEANALVTRFQADF